MAAAGGLGASIRRAPTSPGIVGVQGRGRARAFAWAFAAPTTIERAGTFSGPLSATEIIV